MNSRQRRKANRAYTLIKDFVVIRLRLKGEVTEEQIAEFAKIDNFLLHRLSPRGSYWRHLSPAARKLGFSHYVKEKRLFGRENAPHS